MAQAQLKDRYTLIEHSAVSWPGNLGESGYRLQVYIDNKGSRIAS